MTITKIPPEFEVRYRDRVADCSESSEGWAPAEATARAHELMREGARGIRVMRRPAGGCRCDWALYLRVGPAWCGLRRLFLGFRCGDSPLASREARRAVRRDSVKHPGGCR